MTLPKIKQCKVWIEFDESVENVFGLQADVVLSVRVKESQGCGSTSAVTGIGGIELEYSMPDSPSALMGFYYEPKERNADA